MTTPSGEEAQQFAEWLEVDLRMTMQPSPLSQKVVGWTFSMFAASKSHKKP